MGKQAIRAAQRQGQRGLSQAEIKQGLAALGLCAGDIVEVHSSLSSMGWVEGGASTVVDALLNVVGAEGTVVMSAYPLGPPLPLNEAERAKGITAKVRILAPDSTERTGMGAIADEFRLRPGVLLGEGRHRVAAWGREAETLRRGYDQLLERDGRVLLLGVDIHRCSSMHTAEGLPPEVSACYEVPEEIRSAYPADLYIAYGETPEDGWQKVQDEADRRGLIRHGRIGQAACMLFKAREVVGIYAEHLRRDPLGLFGLDST